MTIQHSETIVMMDDADMTLMKRDQRGDRIQWYVEGPFGGWDALSYNAWHQHEVRYQRELERGRLLGGMPA